MGKTVSFVQTAADFALFKVLKDCLTAEITSKVGYEASLAHCNFELNSLDEQAIQIKIHGFSDKLLDFAQICLDIITRCAMKDFDESQIANSIESVKAECANSNYDVGDRSANNRLLFLLPHTFHDSLLEKVLDYQLTKRNEEDLIEDDALNKELEASDNNEFSPSKMLGDKILSKLA